MADQCETLPPNTWDADPCPRHGTPVKKCYAFGDYGDAEVYVFQGCPCAVCVNAASLAAGVPLGGEITIHKHYRYAAGRAALIAANEAATNAALSGAD